MRRALVAAVAAMVFLGVLPASAAPPVSCEDGGREHFTMAGLAKDVPAPTVAAYELAAVKAHTGDAVTSYRSAPFHYVADFAPAADATVSLKLDWEQLGDFDLFVFDAEGTALGAGQNSNIETDQSTQEQIDEIVLEHCQAFTISVRNWTGSPSETLKLTATVVPGATKLACADSDPAPNCAGKPAGTAPDASPADDRTRLYLGGDPGQLAMAHGYNAQTGAVPFRGTFTTTRPMSGTSNSYTRPVFGFREQYRNPFVPHFSTTFAAPRDINRNVEALLWLSSPTLKDGGTLYADLYADGGVVSSLTIPGAQVPEHPTKPVALSFPMAADTIESVTDLTLQLGTTPAASTTGPGNPSDAVFTIHYGGTQFPSRLTLP